MKKDGIETVAAIDVGSNSIRMVIAQRLVRRLDDTTKQEYEPDEATKQWVKNALKDLPSHIKKPDLDNFKLWKPVISENSPFGFKGRIVIMEQMIVSESIQRFLRGDEESIHTEIIEIAARKDGMVTLMEQGVLSALRGETTLDEVNQVI